jgi:hypothetical protein
LPKYVVIYPPEYYPIPDAQEFNPAGTVATVGVESGTQIPIAPQTGPDAGAVTLPSGSVGIIRSLQISLTNMLTTTDVSFSLLINGGPAGGYGVLKMTPRVAPYVSNTFDTFIRVPNNAKVNIVFSNIDGGSYIIGGSIGGWYWPQSSGVSWSKFGI